MGQPWQVAQIAADLAGVDFTLPSLARQVAGLCEQVEDSLTLYGSALGLRIVRKHIAAHIDKVALPLPPQDRRAVRAHLCRIEDPVRLISEIRAVYAGHDLRVAA